MGRPCSVSQILTIIIGILNYILGVPILVHYFLENHNWEDDETANERGASSRTFEDVQSWNWGVLDIIRLIVVLILLTILTSCSIGCVWSGCKTQYQELLARGAVLLLKIIAVICAINFVAMFILGYHWINLVPLLVWGCVLQVIFFLVVGCYVKELTRERGDREIQIRL